MTNGIGFALVTTVLVVLVLLVWVYSARRETPEYRQRHRNAERLDETHGGSWHYNESNDYYEDVLTDRRIPAKDLE